MKKSRFIRILSGVLSVVMCLQLCTIGAFSTTDETADVPQPQQAAFERALVGELTEKRSANEKYFLYNDQSIVAAVYPQAVHYQDESGTWQEIDNRLAETAEESGNVLQNSANRWRIKFAKKAKDGKLGTLKYGDHTLRWYLEGAQKSEIAENSIRTFTDELAAENAAAAVYYADILDKVDLEYQLLGDTIKENIILQSAAAGNRFTFVYETGALTAAVVDNILILSHGEQEVWKLSAPVMTDAAGMESYAIALSVETIKNNENNHIYAVTVTADETWLKDERRAYPVIVDPTLETEQDRTAITDTYVDSSSPTSANASGATVKVGMNGTSKVYRSLLKFDLPTDIGVSDRVVGASLRLVPYSTAADYDTMALSAPVIEAHRVTADWSESVTWNTQPTYDESVVDYDVIAAEDYDSPFRPYFWDITDMVDSWYTEGNNYGLMLKYDSESSYGSNMVANFASAETTLEATYYPLIQIAYMNMSGLEDYWTYHSLDAGVAGSAFINDFTGALTVVTPIASAASAIVPMDVALVYSPGSGDSSITKLSVGNNFMLSVQSYVIPVTIGETQKYKYVDSDGTVHYFGQSDEVWKDESGLGLILSLSNPNYYIITDKQDNKLLYYRSGRLYKIRDNIGNDIEMHYEDGYLTKITGHKYLSSTGSYDPNHDGHIMTIERDSRNRFSKLWYPDSDGKSRYVQITYTDYGNNIYHLTQYVKSGDSYIPTDIVNFSTAQDSSVLKHIISCPYDADSTELTGTALSFGYNAEADTAVQRRRVLFYKERSFDDGAFGEEAYSVAVTYGKRSTKYTMTLPDDAGKRTELYTFNRFGQTITGQDINGNTVFRELGMSGGSKNKITFASGSQRAYQNLVYNHNFEKKGTTGREGWTFYGEEGSTDNALIKGTAENEAVFIGDNAMKLFKEHAAVTDIAHVKQWITLEGGSAYTLSAYVKTDFETVADADGAGAVLALECLNDSTAIQEYKQGILSPDGFSRQFVTVDLTGHSGSYSFAVVLGIKRARGAAYFDGIQLEEDSCVNSYNALENGSFERNGSAFWTGTELESEDTVSTAADKGGSYGFSVTGNPKKAKKLSQSVTVNGKEGTGITAGVWIKTDTLPNKDTQDDGTKQSCSVTIELCRDNGTSQYESVALDSGNEEWRYVCLGTVAEFDFTDIKLYLKYPYNCNTAYFDDACLSFDTFGQSYTYDSAGNVVSVVDKANTTTNTVTNGNNDLTSYTDGNGNTYTFEYDNGEESARNHLLTGTADPLDNTTEYTYNDYGNVTQTTHTNEAGNLVMQSSTAYTADGHFVQSEKDTTGAETVYDADTQTGRLNSITVPSSNEDCEQITNYEYDDVTKEMTSVTVGSRSLGLNEYTALPVNVAYLYEQRRLTSVERRDDEKQMGYHFTYDEFGKTTGVSWSGKNDTAHTLQETEYYDYLALPKKVTYGNGQQVGYTYTRAGQLKTRSYNNTTIEGYEYNRNNSLGYSWYLTEDGKVGTHYLYDLAGRISGVETSDGFVAGEVLYDKNNNLTQYATSLSTEQLELGYRTEYGYNELNQQTSMEAEAISNGTVDGKIRYGYDGLGRLYIKKVNLEDDDNYIETTVTYKTAEAEDGSTLRTALPSTTQITGTLNGTSIDTKYYNLYDDNGTLSRMRVTENSVHDYTHYVYDELGQLVQWKNTATGASVYDDGVEEYLYTYDNGGNITKTLHKTDDAADYTVTYTYDSNMSDLLTGVTKKAADGTVLSTRSYNYTDAAGGLFVNPLSVTEDGVTTNFNWREGRVLESTTDSDGNTITRYEYNENGLRTYRLSTSGKEFRYRYNGEQLEYVDVYGTDGELDCVLRYFYNADGQAEYILCKTADLFNDARYNLYYIQRDSEGKIHKLIQIRQATATGVEATLETTVEYTYDPYGKVLERNRLTSDPVGAYNCLLYKDYVYDSETGLYYVTSRYYDPEIGRWINADNQIAGVGGEVLGYNMFAYCMNNPVNLSDPSGNWPKWATKLVAAVAVVAVVAVVAAVTVATAGAGTAIAAVAVGAAKGAAIGFAVGAATGAAGGAISHRISTGSWDGAGEAALNGMANGALSGAVSGAITGGITGGLSYNSGATSAGKGFDTYRQLKNEIGSPGAGNEWHHIVEQSQIAKSGFSPQMIQNTNNIMSISKTTHRAISGYYSSVQPFTNGMIVRNWLAGQSFSAQYEFGINVIKMFM